MATPTITAELLADLGPAHECRLELSAPLALDATIAALADVAPAPVITWAAGWRVVFFANLIALRTQLDLEAAAKAREFIAEQLVIAEATSCGYIATHKSTRAVRHAAYSSGLTAAPARPLVNDSAGQKARARVWGHAC